MPGWIMHLVTAEEVRKQLEVDKDSFLFGNILPDVYNGYIVSNLSHKIEHKISHYDTKQKIEEKIYSLPGVQAFVEKNKSILENNSVALGYLTHLMTDYYWNKKTFTKKYIYNEQGKVGKVRLKDGRILQTHDKLEAMYLKQGDFKVFSKFLLNNNTISKPKYQEQLIEKSNEMEGLHVNKQDLYQVFSYLENIPEKVEEKIEESQYQLYSQMDLIEGLQENITQITEVLKKEKKDEIRVYRK